MIVRRDTTVVSVVEYPVSDVTWQLVEIQGGFYLLFSERGGDTCDGVLVYLSTCYGVLGVLELLPALQ